MRDKEEWFIHLNVGIYALAFWLCAPVLPFLSNALGGDEVSFGYFQTLFALAQMLGGPVMGKVVDYKGAKFALQFSHLGAVLSYLFLASCNSLFVLYLSRVFTLTMHTMHSAQAFISGTSDAHGRATALGNLALSYGVGLVIGSTAGGFLAEQIGYQEVALISSIVVLSLLVVNHFWLPSSSKNSTSAEKTPPLPLSSGMDDTSAMLNVLLTPAVLDLTVFQLLVGSGMALFQSNFNAAAPDRFNLEPKELGMLQSYAGILAVVANVVLVRLFTRFFSERNIMVLCSVVFVPVYFLFSLASSRVQLLFLFSIMMLSAGTLYTVLTSAFSKASAEVGTSLGISHAARSASAVIGPLLGTQVLIYGGFEGTGFACCGVATVTVLWMLRK